MEETNAQRSEHCDKNDELHKKPEGHEQAVWFLHDASETRPQTVVSVLRDMSNC